MALSLVEWFGHDLNDWSDGAIKDRESEHCPFIHAPCSKKFSDNTTNGVCVVAQSNGIPVVVCPNRMYGDSYKVLNDVSEIAFGANHQLIHPDDFRDTKHDGTKVLVFGKKYGREIRVPGVKGRRSYFVDWILARIDRDGNLAEFVAVEVQTIDTTGTYRDKVQELRNGVRSIGTAKAGLNWENVNKRILPQIIFKGHVLRREPLCTKGLFFVTTTPVRQRIDERLGGSLTRYDNLQPGSLTFMWYSTGNSPGSGPKLDLEGTFSTTVDQVGLAFTSPQNLPPSGAYQRAITLAMEEL